MDSSTLVLTLRVIVSLAVVLGLVWWFARRNRSGAKARVRPTAVTVVGRQQLGRRAGVAVVEIEGRRLVLGLTDQHVQLLAELDATPAPAERTERTEIDPVELARMVGLDEPTLDDTDDTVHPADRAPAARPEHAPRRPAARTPAVPMQRRPLEGSILDASTWRQAVVAVQERTIRR